MCNIILAMVLGILGTTAFHIAKGMQRHGVEIFSLTWSWFKKEIDTQTLKENFDKPLIYIAGLLLNLTLPVMILVAGMFAPSSYFTSMFGLGLVALMIYSNRVLHEPLTGKEYAGAIVLITGTVILGLENILRKPVDMSTVQVTNLFFVILVYSITALILYILLFRKDEPLVTAILFGLQTGALACLDPVLKGIAQNINGVSALLPTGTLGWTLFILSFICGVGSFALTQVGFARKSRASVQVAVHNSIMIIMPVVLQWTSLPGFKITIITLLGFALTVSGILLISIEFKMTGAGSSLDLQN